MKMNKGDLVQVNIGYDTVEGDPLKCELKRAWGVITEIRREGERLMVHFIDVQTIGYKQQNFKDTFVR